ncbi:MAG: virion core protein [Lachnospiraceae bacterium]|jgi:membrane protease subunit (stomatin/prohibitin family)|nr:virion core protein [Lachnospiraceae bacterium]
MGIIKAAIQSVSGGLADQWLEVFEPDDMGERTILTRGVPVRKGQNTRGSSNTVSNGSVIHVYDNQFMMLVDGGKIVDYTAEPGYYKVDNSALPSLFNGELKDTIQESFERIKFGGVTLVAQKVFYLNLQEIKGIKFGTRNPINYFDNFYNAELFLRSHGTYSIRITDPIKFYAEALPKNAEQVEIEDINEQYLSEFLEALQAAINQMSADGIRISYATSKSRELGRYMADTLDEEWNKMRGIEIQAVGIASVSYDEKSTELINMRNEGAMLGDPNIREGYLQGHAARGLEAAGSNAAGAMAGFMGMGMAMQTGGGVLGAASAANMQQMQNQQSLQQGQQIQSQPSMQQAQQMQNQSSMQQGQSVQSQPSMQQAQQMQNQSFMQQGQSVQSQPSMQQAQNLQRPQSKKGWTCSCGQVNTGKFCSECGGGQPIPLETWFCGCGQPNTGKFCSECGKPKPQPQGVRTWNCSCGQSNTGKFCSQCGNPRQGAQ